ncbi:TetR family transcriptional regulator [Streptomyces albidoflavus]|uniref:TetR/AcrR family transcriptional regulator n=1 Tax=Streptomyces albidoflavus TaxID=1886 RepID=UPI000BAE580D|nr:TetR/AcrR family transcriptional regulator [Streptomyces albidoflavus]PAX84104.1 TetR family transcriptional regulator [Streptomyces albidoflavus]PAX92845.1 TetR family transcriptional regulator [Streptomyces albidoflavus]PBO19211.1 TetR family transcriptional regulator [Streptomyces albidoflavus]PBO21768.1 TetR family transcriptional regulator [Streptomyces albidoflavus]PBO28682.1 TetR family transcriptional regulator [Streptomyces albidoflavus]
MPKIEAGSVREHRAQRLAQLIDAAEAILSEGGVEALTAGAVAARAGIARNSIYRYFDSIDDLLELLVAREFPAWTAAVEEAVAAEDTPGEQVAAYVRANLEQAARGTHGWRASLSRGSLSPSARQRVRKLHTTLHEVLAASVDDLGDPQPELTVAVVQAVTDACVRRIDQGDDLQAVSAYATNAVRRLLARG